MSERSMFMYRKSKAVFIPLAIIAIFAIFYINYPLFSNSNDMVIQQAENMAYLVLIFI